LTRQLCSADTRAAHSNAGHSDEHNRIGFLFGLYLVTASMAFEVASAGSQNARSANAAPSRTTLANSHNDALTSAPSGTAPTSAHDGAPADDARSDKPYFIEFRARNAATKQGFLL